MSTGVNFCQVVRDLAFLHATRLRIKANVSIKGITCIKRYAFFLYKKAKGDLYMFRIVLKTWSKEMEEYQLARGGYIKDGKLYCGDRDIEPMTREYIQSYNDYDAMLGGY